MTIVRSISLNVDDVNGFGSYRIRIVNTGAIGSQGQVRVTFNSASATNALATSHCSIGKALNTTTTSTTATPTELKFSGASGFSIGVNASITSDWTTFSFASTDDLVVIFDIPGGSGGTRNNQVTGQSNDRTWFDTTTTVTWNVATEPSDGTTFGTGDLYGISLIETQSGTIVEAQPNFVGTFKRSVFPGVAAFAPLLLWQANSDPTFVSGPTPSGSSIIRARQFQSHGRRQIYG